MNAKQKAINSIDWTYPYTKQQILTLPKGRFDKALDIAIQEAKKEVVDAIFKDKGGFWINAVTKELNYRQRIIGIIKIEDGELKCKK
jgi:hypothetical protein